MGGAGVLPRGIDRRSQIAGGGDPDGFAGGAGVLPRGIDPRLIACLAAVYLIWSSTYLAMRIAVAELPPLFMAGFRYTAAGLVMLAIARRRGAAWPSAAAWLRVVPAGALLFLGGNGFVAIAERTVSSGGAAVVCATMPLWAGVFAAATGERPSRREWLALLVGFVGVIVLMGGPSLAGEPLHIVFIVLAPMCWAAGSILARRQAKTAHADTFLSSAMQMLTGGATLAAVALLRGEQFPSHAGTASWLALGYLLVFGSLVGFTAYNWLLRHTRPVVATSYAYVNPILAVLIGAAVSGEALGVTTLVANVLIVGAVALALGRPRPPHPKHAVAFAKVA
jgi:drug/metabolite transporter (DMT)-like permease